MYVGNFAVLFGDIARTMKIKMQCEYCDMVFSLENCAEHICQYDQNKCFIFDKVTQDILWHKSALRTMYLLNNEQIENILKQESFLKSSAPEINQCLDGSHYVCKVCKRIYVHATGLARHMLTHKNDNYGLSYIGTKTSKVIVNERHLQLCKCQFCGRIFKNISSVLEHCENFHNKIAIADKFNAEKKHEILILDSLFQCEFCDFVFADNDSVITHENGHDSSIGFECTHCDINSKSLTFINNHRNNECAHHIYEIEKRINLKTNLLCNICESVFDTIEKLYEHRYE